MYILILAADVPSDLCCSQKSFFERSVSLKNLFLKKQKHIENLCTGGSGGQCRSNQDCVASAPFCSKWGYCQVRSVFLFVDGVFNLSVALGHVVVAGLAFF